MSLLLFDLANVFLDQIKFDGINMILINDMVIIIIIIYRINRNIRLSNKFLSFFFSIRNMNNA